MNRTTFWAQVGQARGLLRLHQSLKREYASLDPRNPVLPWYLLPHDPRTRALRWFFVWGVAPALALLPQGVGFNLQWAILMTYLTLFPPLQLNGFEALHVPSRRALYVARLLKVLPWLLWLGVAVTLGLWRLAELTPEAPRFTLAVALTVVQVPWLFVAAHGAFVLVLRSKVAAFGGSMMLALLLVAAGVRVVLRSDVAVPSLAWPLVLLAVTVSLLAFQVWAVGRLEPWRQMQLASIQPTSVSAAAPAAAPGAATEPLPAMGPGRHGIGWAAAYRCRAQFRDRQHGRRQFWANLAIFLSVGLWLYFFGPAVGRGVAEWLASPTDRLWLWLWLLLLLQSRSLLRLDHPQRLYLLGVDYRQQLLHRLRTFWATPALLLTLILMGVAAALLRRLDAPLSFLAMALAVAIFRAGWWEWPSPQAGLGVRKTLRVTLGLALLLGVLQSPGTFFLPDPGWAPAASWLIFAGIAAPVGLIGIGYKLLRLDEATLREALNR